MTYTMIKEFVPYNIAKKFKDLGFDEDCLAYYDVNKELKGIGEEIFGMRYLSRNSGWQDLIAAPLWQQVTQWLRDVHKINTIIDFHPNTKKWSSFSYSQDLNGKQYVKKRHMEKISDQENFDTYEQARESVIIDVINKL